MIHLLRSSRARYWLEGLFVLPVMVLFFHMIYLRHRYTWDMPQVSEMRSGRTIAMRVSYNRIVYVTELERHTLTKAYWLTGTGFGIIFLYAIARKNLPEFPS
jgi:4-amino-4-deoxy-L-arabinose transferase-like glycosyltransferase